MSVADTNYPQIAIVVPYFGKLPNYFPLWLRSCSINPSFHWYVFTDDTTNYSYPENVRVTYCSKEDIEVLIQKALGEDICLVRPHKLCDFKVLYGSIFADYLKNYAYWGYCDVDVVFGDLKRFITSDLLINYKKIYSLGHLSIIPNTTEILMAIKEYSLRSEIKQSVWMNPHTTLFDEWYGKININQLFLQRGWSIYEDTGEISDVFVGSSKFLLTRWDSIKKSVKIFADPCLFQWKADRGLIRYEYRNNQVIVSESCYVHLKERPFRFLTNNKIDEMVMSPVIGIFPSGIYAFDNEQEIKPNSFQYYGEGFFRYVRRRGYKRYRNGLYRMKLWMGYFKKSKS